MKLQIQYQATFLYDEKASLSPHILRIFPRQDLFVATSKVKFSTDESADVQFRQDLFDNPVAKCFFPVLLNKLEFNLDLEVIVRERNPFHFLLDSHALSVPFQYLPEELVVLRPYLELDPSGVALPANLRPGATPKPTIEVLVTLNRWMYENIQYERRDEGAAYEPSELLRLRKGSCRDYAQLFAEILRQNGIAARLVSGFLWEPDTAEADRRAESSLHAWVEAYIPGAGWMGLDPTNGIFASHHFIATAVGLNAAGVAPASGYYYGQKTIGSKLTTTLKITGGDS